VQTADHYPQYLQMGYGFWTGSRRSTLTYTVAYLETGQLSKLHRTQSVTIVTAMCQTFLKCQFNFIWSSHHVCTKRQGEENANLFINFSIMLPTNMLLNMYVQTMLLV
jgi:uncharacterized membrane protein